jgi:regulator of sigma E protease
VTLTVLRAGQILTLELTPKFLPDRGLWALGFEPWDTTVGLVQKGGPAYRIGLREDDRIIAIDDEPVTSFSGIARIINRSAGKQVRVLWQRDGEYHESVVVPEAAEIQPDSTIGRIFFDRKYVHRAIGLGDALRFGMLVTWRTIQQTVSVLQSLVSGRMGLEAVSGPIRIGQVAGEMLRWGLAYLMNFIAFFSVNLFLLNLLPIPVLDGGHVLFLLIEVIRGRRVHERVQAIATQVGLIFLLLFMTFIVVKDVLQVAGH